MTTYQEQNQRMTPGIGALRRRIIPCLDVADGRVVKGVKFKGLRDSGDPVELGRRYSEEGADELVFLDITAGVEGRATAVRMVERVAKEVFIPFTVGGGIRRPEDAHDLLRAGCDKISVNSAAVRRPELISELAARFGSQCVVLAVDAIHTTSGYRISVDAGRTVTEIALEDWLQEGQKRGAGEVLLTSMDCDGGQTGFDLELLRIAAALCKVPLIASGGFGHPRHALEAFQAGADAALAASVFHDEIMSIREVKKYLIENGAVVRIC
jgi:cyclase